MLQLKINFFSYVTHSPAVLKRELQTNTVQLTENLCSSIRNKVSASSSRGQSRHFQLHALALRRLHLPSPCPFCVARRVIVPMEWDTMNTWHWLHVDHSESSLITVLSQCELAIQIMLVTQQTSAKCKPQQNPKSRSESLSLGLATSFDHALGKITAEV